MAKSVITSDGTLMFWCPGCDGVHGVPIRGQHAWAWNGSVESPTLMPSILIRSGHYAPDRESESCWCTYDAENPDKPSGFSCSVCHSFVRDGKIQFLNDCTHSLAGQTVEIPEWE